jgi:hypothetical protein
MPTRSRIAAAAFAVLVIVGLVCLWPQPKSHPASSAAPVQVDSAPVTPRTPLAESLDRLTDAGLYGDAALATALIAQVSPDPLGNDIDRTFNEFILDPTAPRARACIMAAKVELRDRVIDKFRDSPQQRATKDEPTRQVLLRIIIVAEYARASGGMPPNRVEYVLDMAYNAMNYTDASDLRDAVGRSIESALVDEAPEVPWRSSELELHSPGDNARLFRRNLLADAMRIAVEQGRTEAFESYARRYLALPDAGTGQGQQAAASARQQQVADLRARISMPPRSP